MARRRGNRNGKNNVDDAAAAAMGNAFSAFLQNMPDINNNDNSKVVGQFCNYQPPTFNGKNGPVAVEEWFRALERIFRLIECTDTIRVTCAAFQLIEDADHWWESYWRTRTNVERDALTWDEFKDIVMDKFYPQSYRDQKETGFLNFKQRNMSITEYEREFNQLIRFAAHLVDTEMKKATRFKRGLRAHLGGILSAHGDLEYAEMVKRAQNVESSLMDDEGSQRTTTRNEKRKWDGVDEPPVKPRCLKCNRDHHGECLFGQGRCYRCKQLGHESPDCPLSNQNRYHKSNSKPQTNEQSKNRTFNDGRKTGGQARMFAMTCDDFKDGKMKGMIMIVRVTAFVLLVTGTTHS